MFGWFPQDTEEIAELFVIMVIAYVSELKSKGSDALRQGIEKHVGRSLPKSSRRFGVEEYSFFGDGKVKEFFFRIEDSRKGSHGSIDLQIEGNERYSGFKLYCNLLTGRVTVNARGSMIATGKARKLCRVFERKFASATNPRAKKL
jgi:hypothetical protein